MDYLQLLHNLANGINFSFSRWGDGEWTAALGLKPAHKVNCDGHQYFEDMGRELRLILKSKPKYHMGIQPLALRVMGNKIKPYLEGIVWSNADVLHKASISGELALFIEAVATRQVIYVGSDNCIGYLLNAKMVTISPVNCWLQVNRTLAEVRKQINEINDAVVLFSASMAANIMIDRLYNEYGDQHTFIDVGSVFDPYVGKATRKYHKQIIDREHKGSHTIS